MIGAAHKTILYDYVWAAKAPAYFFRSLLGLRGSKNGQAPWRTNADDAFWFGYRKSESDPLN
jgi:hypothetical protein